MPDSRSPLSITRTRRQREPLTQRELEAFWRGHPDFIGPVGPPMTLWLRDREKQALWRKAHALE
jgi:hypothetical protein